MDEECHTDEEWICYTPTPSPTVNTHEPGGSNPSTTYTLYSLSSPGMQPVTGYSAQAGHSRVQELGKQQATGYSAQAGHSSV